MRFTHDTDHDPAPERMMAWIIIFVAALVGFLIGYFVAALVVPPCV